MAGSAHPGPRSTAPSRLRRVRLLVLAGMVVPLLVLLGFQFSWLQELERTSTIAAESEMLRYLDGVVADVARSYREAAVELALSAEAVAAGEGPALRRELESHELSWARRIAILRAGKSRGPQEDGSSDEEVSGSSDLVVWDAAGREFTSPDLVLDRTVRALAVSVFLSGNPLSPSLLRPASTWPVTVRGPAADLRAVRLAADRQLLLWPVTAEGENGARSIAGLIAVELDSDHLRREVLPASVRFEQPPYCPQGFSAVAVRDGEGRPMLPADDERPWDGGVSRELELIFEDWTIALIGPYSTPELWSHRGFLLNLSLTVGLAAIVLAGAALLERSTAQALRLSQMKTDFLSNVSHELRTPLSSIRAFAELLRLDRVRDPRRVREYGAHIEAESKRLAGMIDTVLDFARLEGGTRPLDLQPLRVESVVDESIAPFETVHPGRLRAPATDRPLPPVRADRDALRQMVSNLVDNALKYSPDQLPVRIELAERAGGVRIAVSDRGPGIPPAERERIFERFYRRSSGHRHDTRGTGLGLSIVRHLAEAHGGAVTIEDRPGAGSTFAIWLPLDPAPAPSAARPTMEPAPET